MSGERRRKTKGHYYGAFSIFLFAQKQSIYSSVLQHKYIRKELYYILLGTKKKKKKKSDEGGTDRLSTSAVRIDLFNYFINSYVTSITYTEIQQNTGERGWGPTQGPLARAPPWMSQNQTVKCTLLLSINREATLKKKKYSGERMLEPGEKQKRKKEELKRKGRGLGREGSGELSPAFSCVECGVKVLCRRGQSEIVCNSKSYYQISYGVYSSV